MLREKGENAAYQYFFIYPKSFLKAFSFRGSKCFIVWEELKWPRFPSSIDTEENPITSFLSNKAAGKHSMAEESIQAELG